MLANSPPRRRGGFLVPFLVSANLHAAAIFVLMSTLTPAPPRSPAPVEIALISSDDAAVAIETQSVTLQIEEAVFESAVSPPSLRPTELAISAPPSPVMEQHASFRPSVDAAAQPDMDSLLVVHSIAKFAGLHDAGRMDDRAGIARGVGQPGGRQASFFGTTAYGDRFVYILDMSGSMNEGSGVDQNRFRRATDELLASIDRLAPEQMFYVYLFSHITRPLFDESPHFPRWRTATPENKQLLRAWLETIEPGGNTDPRLALLLGLNLGPDALFLLSDGRFNGKEKELTVGLTKARKRDVSGFESDAVRIPPIHSYAFEDTLACHSMQELAFTTRGIYRFIPPLTRGEGGKAAPLDPQVLAENLLKTAESMERAGRHAEAWEKYREVQQDYPNTLEAEIAQEKAEALVKVIAVATP